MTDAKAGEGLPSFEQIVIKIFLIPIVRVFFTWRITLFLLRRELKIIESLVITLDKSLLQERVVIKRAFAIEDHSRDFSVNMTLEHLIIAGNLVKNVIESLSNDENFDQEIKIENVKPSKNEKNTLEEFSTFMNDYFSYIEKHPKKQSKKTKGHPWFVEFNNADWHNFMFMHTFTHRRQIETIINKLGN